MALLPWVRPMPERSVCHYSYLRYPVPVTPGSISIGGVSYSLVLSAGSVAHDSRTTDLTFQSSLESGLWNHD